MRLWLKRLKNTAYNISNMLDEFQSTVPDAGKEIIIQMRPDSAKCHHKALRMQLHSVSLHNRWETISKIAKSG
uniref:Rx N-terminal domain-containing protein n=1 Tax=Oryza punctata TaxID=4537 RepID=A0A0E0L0V7_ORYPU